VGTLVQLTAAAWPAAAPACVCRLHLVAVRPAALVSDEKRIRGVYRPTRRCAIQITTFTFIFLPFCCTLQPSQLSRPPVP